MLTIGHVSHVDSRNSPLPWLLACGLVVGTLDLAFAMGWWAGRDVGPMRILHSIAAWALGRDAYAGGAATALFGTALQYAVMTAVASVYYLASLRHPRLVREPLRWGALYGGATYVLQHMVLIPLFAAGGPHAVSFDAWMAACIVVYVFLVGIPCALFARAITNGH